MKPYSAEKHSGLIGISGTRKSCDTPHRRRALRRDKKAARQKSNNELSLVTCVYDTDNDGDCHHCAKRGGCKNMGGPYEKHL